MTADLFLIAHKVYGEPAFDVAHRVECAVCHADPEYVDFEVPAVTDCHECSGDGFWWMVHGRRAYPWWNEPLDPDDIYHQVIGEMPSNLPDHYQTRAASASASAPSGLAALLAKRKPLGIERRGR